MPFDKRDRITATTDPLLMEILKNSLVAITEEMSETLYRSAYSTNIKTRKDLSCALFDNPLRLVAQSFAQPAHLGVIYRTIPMVIEKHGEENLGPGDAIAPRRLPTGGGAGPIHIMPVARASSFRVI